MVSSLIFVQFRTATAAMVVKVLHQRYSPLLGALSGVQSAAVCQEFSATVSELLGASLEIKREWAAKGDEETDDRYALRIQREVAAVRDSGRSLLVIVPESVMCEIAGRAADELAVAVLTDARELVFLSKFEAYPILRPLKSTAESISAAFREAKVGTSSAAVADPKRIAVKQFQGLHSAMDAFKERAISFIDRMHKQSEKHLEDVENELYKKMQLKLQKIDDFIQAQKPITAGLEDVKARLGSSAEVTGIRKRLEALNTTLVRCQKDLQELENSASSYADDPFMKMLPLHIMKDTQLVGDVVYIRVVNLKAGTIRSALMRVSDEQDDAELNVLDLKPGVQKIGIRLKRDLYSLVFLRVVFFLQDQEISNQLEVEFADEAPPKPPVLATEQPSIPRVLPEESKSEEAQECRDSPPSMQECGDAAMQECGVISPDMQELPGKSADKVEFELNGRELELLRQTEELFQEESKSEVFRSRFLAIIRRPRGDRITLQELANMMLEQQ